MGTSERVAVVVQARSTSTRLPGKALMDLGDHKVIDCVIWNCMAAMVGPVVLAVPRGDALVEWARLKGVLYVEGSESEVTERVWSAGLATGAEHVVRVTGDCPLLWPDLLRWLVRDHLDGGNDFTTVCRGQNRVPDGLDVEVISMELLRLCVNRSGNDPSWAEHVTKYVYDCWDELKSEWKLMDVRYPLPMGPKWSLDTVEDLERIRKHVEGQ